MVLPIKLGPLGDIICGEVINRDKLLGDKSPDDDPADKPYGEKLAGLVAVIDESPK